MYCNKDSSKCVYDPHTMTAMPPCCYAHLLEVIFYICNLFESHNIPYWLYYGTLLGAVRNQKLIPWDSDGDIGVFISDKKKIYKLVDKINQAGYYFYEYASNLFQIAYSETNFIYCDIWLYDKVPAHKHKTDTVPDYELLYPIDLPIKHNRPIMKNNLPWMQINHTADFPYWFVKKLDRVKLEGQWFYCPRYPKKVLELIYGSDWEIPMQKPEGLFGHYHPLSHWFNFIDTHR